MELRLKRLEKLAAEKGDAEAANAAGDIAIQLATNPETGLPRRIIDEATPEFIGVALRQQGGRIASMSAEGGDADGWEHRRLHDNPNDCRLQQSIDDAWRQERSFVTPRGGS